MWIRTIPPESAEGRLKQIYDAALQRAGRVYRILECMSLNPATLEGMLAIYRATMFAPSPLSRAQREMLAVAVSRANRCEY